MAAEARHKVGLSDVAVAVAKMAPALPGIARGLPGLLRKPTDRESIGALFQRAASKHPDRPFIRFEHQTLTYGQADRLVNQCASVLAEQGVRRGDVVGVLAMNSARTLLIALAVVKLGAAAGMLNFNQRGEVLGHSLGLLNARMLVVDPACSEALDSLEAPGPECSVLTTDELFGLAHRARRDAPAVTSDIRAHETAFFIFTSGTTGMPKASVMSHFRWLKSMSGLGKMGVRLRRDDVLYCCLPLYHNNALTVSLSSVLASGAAIAIGKQFSVSNFWTDIEENEATAFAYIGELCRYLLSREQTPDDRNNGIRLIVGNGLRPEIWTEFTERFGIDRVAEFYGASECNIAFVNAFDIDRTAGFCPLPYAVVHYDEESGTALRNADGRLTRVAAGEVGLLLAKVTHRAPFDGYSDERATQRKLLDEAFENGDRWFDTGDLVRRQGFRNVSFIDRLGDTFRWKGENVATTEVEGALGAHPDIEQAVVFGVEVPGTDGKAGMAALTLRTGARFDGASVARHAFAKLPAYAVPLFVRIVPSLESTSTFKSKKTELRATGYAEDSGDLYVLKNRQHGYVHFYAGYPNEVGSGTVATGSASNRR